MRARPCAARQPRGRLRLDEQRALQQRAAEPQPLLDAHIRRLRRAFRTQLMRRRRGPRLHAAARIFAARVGADAGGAALHGDAPRALEHHGGGGVRLVDRGAAPLELALQLEPSVALAEQLETQRLVVEGGESSALGRPEAGS